MINDKGARNAIVGLEAMCMVPLLLKGDPERGVDANPKAAEILTLVTRGDEAALGALAYLAQPERRRFWGMMTQRQRRIFFLCCFAVGYPLAWSAGLLDNVDTSAMMGDFLGGFVDCSLPESWNNTACMGSASGSWADYVEPVVEDTVKEEAARPPPPDSTNPSYYVLGLLPLVSSLFINLFGQRIASLITLATVFFASAGATIAAALSDDSTGFVR